MLRLFAQKSEIASKLDFLWVKWGGVSSNNRYFKGSIADVRIWNKARTGEEIKADMRKAAPSTSGLMAYWRFNEGSGNTVKDYSGNGRDITANAALTWIEAERPF